MGHCSVVLHANSSKCDDYAFFLSLLHCSLHPCLQLLLDTESALSRTENRSYCIFLEWPYHVIFIV